MEAIIFDLDGTLVDSTKGHIDSWIEALKIYGYNVNEERVRKEMGKTSIDIARALTNSNNIKLIEKIAALKDKLFFKKYFAETVLLKNVLKVLRKLRSMNIKIYVASSNPRKVILRVLESTGINIYIDDIVGIDDVDRGKPDPQPFLYILNKHKLRKDECIVVGDSIYDMIAGKRAGLKCLCILSGINRRAELLNAGADNIISNISELLKYI